MVDLRRPANVYDILLLLCYDIVAIGLRHTPRHRHGGCIPKCQSILGLRMPYPDLMWRKCDLRRHLICLWGVQP